MTSPDSRSALIERRNALLGKAYSLFYEDPVHLVRGEGAWLFDADGKRYLDMYNNVAHVGHCHPHVVEALKIQIETLNTHTRYLHENVLDYAERLTGKFEPEIDKAMFTCTGSEANELALRIARNATGGTGVIVTHFAYHGNTQAIYEISPEDLLPEDVPPYILTVPSPDVYRGEHRGEDAAERYADYVAAALDTFRERGVKPAAFVVDTIISSCGVVEPPPGYFDAVAKIVRDAGALFIADEVQPGFGRTGENFWGYQVDELVPDIVTMGKPMGNGHPVAGVTARRELVEAFADKHGYFNTFGGNPVSCAAALATLDVIEQENLQQNALEIGGYMRQAIEGLAEQHEAIGDVRGTGLFLGVELVTDRDRRTPATELAKQVVNQLKDEGVLTGRIGPDENILKLRPPMVVNRDQASLMINALDTVLSDSRI